MTGETDSFIYVYGVCGRDAPAVDMVGVGEGAGPVRALPDESRSLVALVSDTPQETIRARRGDLSRHTEVVQRAAADGTIIPLRFGTIMPDERTVREELLEARRPQLEALLARLDGHVELSVKAFYEESVFAEIVEDDREIAQLRERVASLPEAASYYDRIRLGELIAAALEARRERDAAEILDRLAPLAADLVRGELTHERGVVNLAFLVARDKVSVFDAAAEDVAQQLVGRITVRLTGPLAPFSFSSLDQEPSWA